MNFSENFTELAAALVKAMGEVEAPKHNKKVTVRLKDNKGQYDYWYADLAGINAVLDKPFAKHGLRVLSDVSVQKTDTGHSEISVQTLVLHESGQWMKSECIKFMAAHGIQDLGGQITYLKRYSLSATLNLATEADDDAQGAKMQEDAAKQSSSNKGAQNANKGKQSNGTNGDSKPPVDPNQPKAVTENQKKMIHAVIKAISDTQNVELDKVYPRIQEIYKTDVPIDQLTQQSASGLITELKKFEAGKALY